MSTLGSFYGFTTPPTAACPCHPPPTGPSWTKSANCVHVQGVVVDVVRDAFAFTPVDLAASPANLRFLTSSALPAVSSPQPGTEPHLALHSIWRHVQELAATSPTAYGADWLTAFSLTFIAGISTYTCAEDNIAQHRRDFAAYFRLWLPSVFGAELTGTRHPASDSCALERRRREYE